MKNKTNRDKQTTQKEEKNKKLTNKKKKEYAIYMSLPKESKIKRLLKDNTLTFRELEIAFPALMMGCAFDRKNIANMYTLGLMMQTTKRELDKMQREQERRYESRIKCSKNERSYFENRILFGWSEDKVKIAKATEIVNILIEYDKDNTKREYFESEGVDLKALIRSISDNKVGYIEIFNKKMNKLKKEGRFFASNKLKGIAHKADKNIERMNTLANTLINGEQRPYIPYLEAKQKEEKENIGHELYDEGENEY